MATKTTAKAKRVFLVSSDEYSSFDNFGTLGEVKEHIIENGDDPEQCVVYEATIRYKVKVGEVTFTKAEIL